MLSMFNTDGFGEFGERIQLQDVTFRLP